MNAISTKTAILASPQTRPYLPHAIILTNPIQHAGAGTTKSRDDRGTKRLSKGPLLSAPSHLFQVDGRVGGAKLEVTFFLDVCQRITSRNPSKTSTCRYGFRSSSVCPRRIHPHHHTSELESSSC